MAHTHFGYREVDESQKESLVRGVFSSVASRYDHMNDVMSFGIHRLWKREMLNTLNPKPGTHLLDVAGGTGDIAFAFLDKQPDAHATLCDINPDMLHYGQKRAIDKGVIPDSLSWYCGNAEALPFPDNHFHYYTIAFGIRNVTHINNALAEAKRVLKPGGRFLCLEFSKVHEPVLQKFYQFYSFKLIPQFGRWIAKDRDSYQYLVESIERFPCQMAFADMIKNAGFQQVTYRNLSGGIVALHSGWKV